MFENMEVLGWFPWPRPWPVRWAHPTQPPWPDHRRCGPRCGSLLHPLDDKKAILIIPCHLLSMFPFVLHWFTMFYPILAPCPSHALYPCHSSTLEAPKSVASHDVTRYELPQVPWVPAKFPPGSHRAPRPRYIPRSWDPSARCKCGKWAAFPPAAATEGSRSSWVLDGAGGAHGRLH